MREYRPLESGDGPVGFARLSTTGLPWIALEPDSCRVATGAPAHFEAAPAESYSNVSYHWLRDGQPINDGPGGASPGGGTVSGASGTLPSPTDGSSAVLTIASVQPSDAGVYTVVFTNPCGSVTSRPATLTVADGSPTCPADWNNDTLINSADISAFLAAWLDSLDNQTLVADFDGNETVNSSDISAFLAAWLDAVTVGC